MSETKHPAWARHLDAIGDYDGKPRYETATESDYTLNTSLGWDF